MAREQRNPSPNERYRRISRYVFFGFVAVAGYFVIAEHRAHIVPVLPYVLLAACPLMHLFHHGGRGHGRHKHGDDDSDSEARPPSNAGGGAHQH